MPKPLGTKAYGSIPHLPDSRLGPGDHFIDPGQARICTQKTRDKHDTIIVQEKLDGSNVAVARIDGQIVPLTRSGHVATTSRYEQHHFFARWVRERLEWFEFLPDKHRVCGEWLAMAHGTRYQLRHEPFVAFDVMTGTTRFTLDQFEALVPARIPRPHLLHRGQALPVAGALELLGEFGHHGALDAVEGVVYRVERNELIAPGRQSERRLIVEFLAKFVHHFKQDGRYLPEVSGGEAVWLWRP